MLQVHQPLLKERARGIQAHMSVAPLWCLPNAKNRRHEAASRGISWSTQDTVLEMQTLPREGQVQRTFRGLPVLVVRALPDGNIGFRKRQASTDLRGLAVRYML